MTELTQTQRDQRREKARAAIENRLRDTWSAWKRTARTPDFSLASHLAVDALGDLAAEILADGTLFKAMTVKDGVLTLETEPAREILLTLVASMRGMLDGYGAENYLETEIIAKPPSVALDLRDGQNPADDYTVTIQRRTRPTPHQFRAQAEAKYDHLADTAKAALDVIEDLMRDHQDPGSNAFGVRHLLAQELLHPIQRRPQADIALAAVLAECDAIEAELHGRHDEDDDGMREAVTRIRARVQGDRHG